MSDAVFPAGWRVPSERIYPLLGPPPKFWQEDEDGLLTWLPLETPTPIFDQAAMRHNGILLGKRRGMNPADEPPVMLTARRGGITFTSTEGII